MAKVILRPWFVRYQTGGAGGLRAIRCGTSLPGGCSSVHHVPCRRNPDFNTDGRVDGSDVEAFFRAWEAGEARADFNADGGVDGGDIAAFFEAWEAG